MLFFFIAVLAGALTVLAPCIFPLLPVVIGTSDSGSGRKLSARSLRVVLALCLSIFVFTLLLKASTVLITIPTYFWAYFSGVIIIALGLFLLFPDLLQHVPGVRRLHTSSNQLVGAGYQKQSAAGDVLIGVALGPVFSTCSPTYLFIIATVLPASFAVGVVYLVGFILGLAATLLLIAYFGQQLINALVARIGTAVIVKQAFAGLIILVGIAIVTGYDKKFEAWVLDSGYGATIDFENELIEQFGMEDGGEGENDGRSFAAPVKTITGIPPQLAQAFPNTDWNKADPKLANAISGGPGKDGIPAIDNPVFEPISTFTRDDSVPAIFLDDNGVTKVYPYNILNWHEIVNDTVNGVPVAITFCPLCGSAIVFERTVGGEVTTFGVSGSLLESNMIMYDRASETLWQQSTGEALAGKHFGTQLPIVSMQLSTMGEIKVMYPNALILSENTGHVRQYSRDPYEGYTENDRFVFDPTNLNRTYHPKELFMAFRTNKETVAVRQSQFVAGDTATVVADNTSYTISKTGAGFLVLKNNEESIPFYFEMWFSLALQREDALIVVASPD